MSLLANFTGRSRMPSTRLVSGLASAAALLVAGPAFAADADATGIDSSFITMLADMEGMLGGNFAALILLMSMVIGIGAWGITGNFRLGIGTLGVAFVIGYGFDIIQGIGGVTASTDMIEMVEADSVLEFSPHVTVQ